MGRKPGKTPKFAGSQNELCSYLTPPRDRKTIQAALKVEGNPGRTKDGRYEIGEWQSWIAQNMPPGVGLAGAGGKGDKHDLEVERLKLQNAKLSFELEVKRKDFTSNTDIEQSIGKMVMEAKRVLLSIPSKLAPVLPGMNEVEIEKRLRRELIEALGHLSLDPMGLGLTISPSPTPEVP
jgi:hypothetical protein